MIIGIKRRQTYVPAYQGFFTEEHFVNAWLNGNYYITEVWRTFLGIKIKLLFVYLHNVDRDLFAKYKLKS